MVGFFTLVWSTLIKNTEVMAGLLGLQIFLAVLIVMVIAFEERPTSK